MVHSFTCQVDHDTINLSGEEGMMGGFPQILTSRAERVTCDKLPHASKELSKTTIEKGHADYDIRNGNMLRLYVVKGQDERCRCKSKKSTTWSMSFQVRCQTSCQ